MMTTYYCKGGIIVHLGRGPEAPYGKRTGGFAMAIYNPLDPFVRCV